MWAAWRGTLNESSTARTSFQVLLHFGGDFCLRALDTSGPPSVPGRENRYVSAIVAVRIRSVGKAVVKQLEFELLVAELACASHFNSVLGCGDAANQVFLLGLAFGSDRKGVEQAKGQGVLDGFILAIA